jgi:hypothetical protein
VASSAGPSPHRIQRQRLGARPRLQRRDHGVRPARDQLHVPLPPRITMADQPIRADGRIRPQQVLTSTASRIRPFGQAGTGGPAAAGRSASGRSSARHTPRRGAAALPRQRQLHGHVYPVLLAQHRIGQLEQCIPGACRASVQLAAEPRPTRPRQLTPTWSWTGSSGRQYRTPRPAPPPSDSVRQNRRCRGGRLLSRRHASQHTDKPVNTNLRG